MLFSILWVYSSSGVCDLKNQTCILIINTICLLPENDIFWANQASSPDSIVFPVRDRRHGASSQVLRDEHFCKKWSCNVTSLFTHCQWQKNKSSSAWCGIVVTRQILEICLLCAICIQQTVFGCSSTPGHTRLGLHQTRLRGKTADIQRRLQAMDVWGGSKIKTRTSS